MNSQNLTHNQEIEALLQSIIPQADKLFEQKLETSLLTQLKAIRDEEKSDSMRSIVIPRNLVRRVAFVMGVIIIIFVITLTVSPTVRAQVQEIIINIAGITFYETDQYPETTPYPSWNSIDSGADFPNLPVSVSHQSMPLSEAQTIIPFNFVPKWTPQDTKFVNVIVDELEFSDGTPGWQVQMIWARSICQGCDRSNIYLEAVSPLGIDDEPEDVTLSMVVGAESVEEFIVNRSPAALIRGYWFTPARNPSWPWPKPAEVTPTPKWRNDGSALGLRLIWLRDGVLYTLMADEDYVSVDELIDIAESIP